VTLPPLCRPAANPLPNTLRREFEPFFAHDLSRVRIHVDQPARQLATHLAADAFAMGHIIGFAANRFRPDTIGGRRLLVHELAHVVQQGAIPAVDANKWPKALPPAAERQADSAALAYLAGRPGPALSRFQPGLACAVKTNGGEFDTDRYTPTNVPPKKGGTVGKTIGASISLHFTPNLLVEADLIGTVQTVRTLRATKAGGPINATSFPTAHKGTMALGKTESDPGRVIDQTDTGTKRTPNTNPLYATDAKPGAIPKTLTEGVPAPETTGTSAGYGKDTFGEHGHRKKKPDGTFDVKKATLADSPQPDYRIRQAGMGADLRSLGAGAFRPAGQYLSRFGRMGLEMRRRRYRRAGATGHPPDFARPAEQRLHRRREEVECRQDGTRPEEQEGPSTPSICRCRPVPPKPATSRQWNAAPAKCCSPSTPSTPR
jgi:hypothetical protein